MAPAGVRRRPTPHGAARGLWVSRPVYVIIRAIFELDSRCSPLCSPSSHRHGCALLLACASQAPVSAPSAPPEPAPVAAASELPDPPDSSIYPLLLAEFALRRQAYDIALEQYLAQAPQCATPASAPTPPTWPSSWQEQAALAAGSNGSRTEPDNVEANTPCQFLLIRQGRAVEAMPHWPCWRARASRSTSRRCSAATRSLIRRNARPCSMASTNWRRSILTMNCC